MTPRKFDLEKALVVLQDEFSSRLVRDLGRGGGDKSKGWCFEAYNEHITWPVCSTVEEAAKVALRKLTVRVLNDIELANTHKKDSQIRLELIKSLGNIGKDDDN